MNYEAYKNTKKFEMAFADIAYEEFCRLYNTYYHSNIAGKTIPVDKDTFFREATKGLSRKITRSKRVFHGSVNNQEV